MVDSPDKIDAALKQLDPANNDHWTDDGLPKTAVVQKIAKDMTITRSDIQAARPGFDRDLAKASLPQQMADFEDPALAPAPTPAPEPLVQGDNPASNGEEMVEISDEQLQALLEKRVADGEKLIEDGRSMVARGLKMQEDGQKALMMARRDKNKYFPPITPAQNIQSYLEASNAERAARVAHMRGASQLDRARGGGNSRGWGRGHARGAFSRQEAARMGFIVPGSPAAAGRGGGGVKA